MSQPQGLHTLYRSLSEEDLAGKRCLQTLLNCYCREVAGPAGHISIGTIFGQNDWPVALQVQRHQSQGQVMQILLPDTGVRLLMVVETASTTGNYRYGASAYFKRPGQPWTLLDWNVVARLLIGELAVQNDTRFNEELLAQIEDSVAVTRRIVSSSTIDRGKSPCADYLASEQSLFFGHGFHPAPKSRQGFSREDVERFSPELGTGVPLHYFAVRREYLHQVSLLAESCDALVADQAPAGLLYDNDFALIPAHPWQGRWLRGRSLIRKALQRGSVRDLGSRGPAYFPTSSIRTLFHPNNPYFYKCSLHVRITNCVRKNVDYELEGALQVTRLLRDEMPRLTAQFPALRVLEEPAYMTVELPSSDARVSREVKEGFGLILRRSVADMADPGVIPVLAGALFGDRVDGGSHIEQLIKELAGSERETYASVAQAWFDAYVERSLHPILYCYFERGIVFEPHLQNVLIGLDQGWPRQLFLRDFEGVKLIYDYLPVERWQGLHERVKGGLGYSPEQGWNRIAYCLLVNNFCEAIAHISRRQPALEKTLWAMVGDHLAGYRRRYGSPASAGRINSLLAGEPLPCKGNLLNRFLKRPDREAGYLPLPNPLVETRRGYPWS